MEKRNDYLTTSKKWDLLKTINELPDQPMEVCYIILKNRDIKKSINEECGDWVITFWKEIIEQIIGITGHRISWYNLLFINSSGNKLFKTSLIEKLQKIKNELFMTRVLFSQLKGTSANKFSEIENMELQLSKINYWEKHIFSEYYEDGIKMFLNK